MAGVTDAPFRRQVGALGAGLVISEMTASGKLAAGEARARLQTEGEGTGIRVVQLAGCEPGPMAAAARIAEQSGAEVIDINMGCPAKKVINGYSGSALMRDLDHALTLIDATVDAVQVPVTLKMRLGWDEASINAPELAARAARAGVRMITVHGRTRCQFYQGRADWRAIRAVKAAVSVPVVANGDIADAADADRALRESGADALMVGRAALGQPWLVSQLAAYLQRGTLPPAPPLAAQEALLLELYEDMLRHHGEEVGSRHARKHLRAAVDRLLGDDAAAPESLRQARLEMLTSRSPAAVMRSVRALYAAAGERMAA
jgi:tRNA-dihydrouridine synthase B